MNLSLALVSRLNVHGVTPPTPSRLPLSLPRSLSLLHTHIHPRNIGINTCNLCSHPVEDFLWKFGTKSDASTLTQVCRE